jgi:hypothetical protein
LELPHEFLVSGVSKRVSGVSTQVSGVRVETPATLCKLQKLVWSLQRDPCGKLHTSFWEPATPVEKREGNREKRKGKWKKKSLIFSKIGCATTTGSFLLPADVTLDRRRRRRRRRRKDGRVLGASAQRRRVVTSTPSCLTPAGRHDGVEVTTPGDRKEEVANGCCYPGF